MAVAITSTVNLIFGSLVMDPVTGILFNDEVREADHAPLLRTQDKFFTRWMIFPYQEFLTLSVFGLHHVCFLIVRGPTIVLIYADNYPEAQKRPLSSTAPTIIENSDGSFYLVLGGSGGSHILSGIFQVILNLDWGLDIGSAIEYGRLHHQLYPEWVEADDVYPSDLLLGLQKRGHTLRGA
jgi:gamma-glutamyltranspeptidase/glutathione hydrolase/leukotriene-C4 hydrolase